ncbi:hypothetical protein FAVG1_12883 [Fusarium avenaceum]|nr:hypothetical protein FAVG1_12883 [Fusarium avenaceum]
MNNNQPVSYAALSYCWGDAEQNRFKTKKDTLTMRKQGFHISQLPRTLRDAVKATCALGLTYLWVDALCIIQDDPEDKNGEISRMWQIYRNATITISASSASHSDQGFLHERNLASHYLSTWAIPWHHLNVENKSIPDTVFCAEGDIRRGRPDVIDSRAWTMQEHKLAGRLLRFGSSQMVWRCTECYIVDGGSMEADPPSEFSTVEDVEAYFEWQHSVEEFTSRFISKFEDRLPAFAAIAAHYGKKLNVNPDEYVAGLWKPWLAVGLLWYVEDVHDKATCRTQEGQDKSPTWSWHLARSGVSWPYIPFRGDTDNLKLHVTYCHTELVDDRVKYGCVRRGILKVVGALLKIRLRGTRAVYTTKGGSVVTPPIQIKWDKEDTPSEADFYCLEIRTVKRFLPQGIVLEQTSDGVFRRAGYFEPDDQVGVPADPIWVGRQSITIE